MKIGVYICHCGVNIASTVNIEQVRNFACRLPRVSISRDYQYMCSDPGQELIKKDINALGLDRIVIASCSPRMHELMFRKAIKSAGLNPYFLDIANIREQCSWVHPDQEQGTLKAKELLAAAIARVSLHEPLQETEATVVSSVLVIGGGIAGIQSSIDIAEAGFEVYLIEKSPALGGHVAQLNHTFPRFEDASQIFGDKIAAGLKNPLIHVMTNSEVVAVDGYVGNFLVKVRQHPRLVDAAKCNGCRKCEDVCPVRVPDDFNMGLSKRTAIYRPASWDGAYLVDMKNCLFYQKEGCRRCVDACPQQAVNFAEQEVVAEVDIGTIIVATGYDVFDARCKPEYGYGRYQNVITGIEFERLSSPQGPTQGHILPGGKDPRHVVFIQCVGSRDKTVGNEYCSRVCCMVTAKQARTVKELMPAAKVTVCYIDVRAFGKGCEQFYENVQKQGVLYRKGIPSEIFQRDGKLIVKAEDELLGEAYEEEADLVVLATGLTKRGDAEEIRSLLKLSKGPDQFYLEAHPKLRPLDTSMEGIYLAGTCHGPKDITDTLAQAHGAASRATSILFAGRVIIDPVTSAVDELLCAGCGLCEKVCEYGALKINSYLQVMTVNKALCKACGACQATCPSGAMSVSHYKKEQIMAQIDEIAC
jgi:heterodisulfide reductase subunit A2